MGTVNETDRQLALDYIARARKALDAYAAALTDPGAGNITVARAHLGKGELAIAEGTTMLVLGEAQG